MAITDSIARTILPMCGRLTMRRTGDEPYQYIRVWAVVAGPGQFGRIHHIRVQLCEAEDGTGLALVRRVLRFPHSLIYRNVRVSVDDLSAFWMADEPLSGSGLAFA